MGTKTVDEAGSETGAEEKRDPKAADVTKADTDEVTETETEATAEGTEATAEDEDDDVLEAWDESDGPVKEGPSGVGQGAAAVVAAVLGFVSLSGSWIGTIAGDREQLEGQLGTSSTASVATQIKEVYGDAWHATAVAGGVFALIALLVGVAVLVRPAFGAPGKPQENWIKSVAWGGIALGVIGLLLAVAKFSDIIMGLPSAS
ncbi:hypothetical protein OK074_0594 [Actinobacteria bacterium OK074]|nr:hypothetical protein OK074_0594 [Actinobacteria bacterium OK074]